jgi:hypothetical protein
MSFSMVVMSWQIPPLLLPVIHLRGRRRKSPKFKITQIPENSANHTKEDPVKNTTSEPQTENNSNLSADSKVQNTMPFPSTPEASNTILQDPIEEEPEVRTWPTCTQESTRNIQVNE